MLALLLATASAITPTFQADAGLSFFPTGLRVRAFPGLKQRLMDPPEGELGEALFGDTYLKLEGVFAATPAYLRAGPKLTFAPIAVFNCSAYYLPTYTFGNFTGNLGLPTADFAWSPKNLREVVDAGNQGPGGGVRMGVTGTLQAKAGPIVAASTLDLSRWDMDQPEGVVGDYTLHLGGDMVAEWDDVITYVDTIVGYQREGSEKGKSAIFGVLDSHGSAKKSGNTTWKAGPVVAIVGKTHSVFAVAQYYIRHNAWDGIPPYLGSQYTFSPKPKP